jgi:hypothetical protein
MRKNYLMMAFVSLFAVVAFSSCNEDNGGTGGGIDLNDNKITAVVENGASYNSKISLVKVKIDDYGYEWEGGTVIIATTPYINGGFTLNLPESVDVKYLHAMFDEDTPPEGVTISNPNAKTVSVELEAYNKSGNSVGSVFCSNARPLFDEWGNENWDGSWIGFLMYANANVSVIGTYSESYSGIYKERTNVHLTKGWNVVYQKSSYRTENNVEVADFEITSTLPAGVSMKWYINEIEPGHNNEIESGYSEIEYDKIKSDGKANVNRLSAKQINRFLFK